MDDSVPTEDKIEWAVKRLRNNRYEGPSVIQADHFNRWLATARKAKKDKETTEKEEAATTTKRERIDVSAAQKETESENWRRVVDLVHSAFREGKLVEEAMWQAVVLIPKGNKDYRGIGLVEVMCKLVAAILNRRLTASITFHNFLNGFRAGRGTGTTTLKTKLLQ